MNHADYDAHISMSEMPAPIDWPTVRRHPRTLGEAFPDERAPAIEHVKPVANELKDVLLALLLWVVVCMALGIFMAVIDAVRHWITT